MEEEMNNDIEIIARLLNHVLNEARHEGGYFPTQALNQIHRHAYNGGESFLKYCREYNEELVIASMDEVMK